jgi:hypothetical protein
MPCRTIRSETKLALELQSRNPLFRAAHDGKSHEPSTDRQMRLLKDCAYGHGELLSAIAVVALKRTMPMPLAFKAIGVANGLAVRASDAIPPHDPFERGPRLIFC